jgi:hypothetical protein
MTQNKLLYGQLQFGIIVSKSRFNIGYNKPTPTTNQSKQFIRYEEKSYHSRNVA